jgi:hypothetical protein
VHAPAARKQVNALTRLKLCGFLDRFNDEQHHGEGNK